MSSVVIHNNAHFKCIFDTAIDDPGWNYPIDFICVENRTIKRADVEHFARKLKTKLYFEKCDKSKLQASKSPI